MASVEFNKVQKRFGNVEVIHCMDIDIADGEFVVIVGPSGCGKSTLLRMVAGLETITSGELLIGGVRANEKEPMERDIAMVFQNYALYPHMSVAQNMGYGLKISGMPKADIERKVTASAKLLQLDNLLNRKPRELSGGQRQRVAMGRAIVREPKVFLFDEPLSNLDAKLRVQMRLEIRELQAKLGVTSLYVTHDQTEAMTMADRMIVMHAGNVEQIGAPLDVYQHPETLFAAQFIGSPAMNIIETVAHDGCIEIGGASLKIPVAVTGLVKVGIRPEHVHQDPQGVLELRVGMAEPLGANTLLHGTLTHGNLPFTATLPGIDRIGLSGKSVRLTVRSDDLHLFDAATERRLG